jgi:hypothetical protein
LNPVQTSAAGMDPVRLKELCRGRLAFWGGSLDCQKTLPYGTVDEVVAGSRTHLQVFAPGGGYVFAPVHNIQAGVPPENVIAMYDTARRIMEPGKPDQLRRLRMSAWKNERDRVPPVVSPRNWPALVATVLLTMLAVPDRLWADQEHQLPTFRHRGVVLDYADLTYNPCNDVIVPSVIETDRLHSPLGRYYMYYAPHDAPGGICLAYADAPEGPWKEYPANPLIAREWPPHHAVSHVSGPHAIWIDEEQKLFVYYHGENDVTRMASTTDGIRFRYEGVAVTTKMFDDISEASYARVFRYVLPGRDNRYVMLLMGNNRGTRRIYLAWSQDGRSWESRRTPLLDPPVGTNQIAQAWYFPWRDRHYLIYHGHLTDSFQTANLYVSEVDASFERPVYRGLFYDHTSGPPGNVAQMSPCFLPANGKIYMYTNVGPRLHQKIAVAVADARTGRRGRSSPRWRRWRSWPWSQTDSAGPGSRRRCDPTMSLVQELPGRKRPRP